MIRISTTLEFDDQVIPVAINAAADERLPRGAERIEQRAKQSIVPGRRMLLSELPPKVQAKLKRSHKPLPGVPSRPGDPPHSISGILPRLISSGVDNHVAVVGPARSGKRGYPAAGALEFGRTTTIFGRQITIEPRPFMGPAMMAVLPTLANDFRDSVKG